MPKFAGNASASRSSPSLISHHDNEVLPVARKHSGQFVPDATGRSRDQSGRLGVWSSRGFRKVGTLPSKTIVRARSFSLRTMISVVCTECHRVYRHYLCSGEQRAASRAPSRLRAHKIRRFTGTFSRKLLRHNDLPRPVPDQLWLRTALHGGSLL